MAAVRASKRISIAWSGAAAYEDTDTVVLTINGYSLDLRVYATGAQQGQLEWSTMSRVVEVEGSTQGVFSQPIGAVEKPILKWDPIINSRESADMDDQGSFTTLENGDVQEEGIMENPASQTVEAYVEIWRRLYNPVGAPYCVLERVDTEKEGMGTFIGRVGSRALGLGRDQRGYMAWRDELGDGGLWNRVYELGGENGSQVGEEIPRLPVEMPRWKQGETVSLGSHQWIVLSAGQLP